MPTKKKTIVVAGDVTIDWLRLDTDPRSLDKEKDDCTSLNWQFQKCTGMVARGGGAKLLASLVEEAGKSLTAPRKGIRIGSPVLDNIGTIPPSEVVHSFSILGKEKESAGQKKDKPFAYRVREFCGYAGDNKRVKPRIILNDYVRADLVVLDDAGNGFCQTRNAWPQAIKSGKGEPIVVLKMVRPPNRNKLWNFLWSNQRHSDRLVVVISANDLRESGVNISRRLSWERAAEDFIWQIVHNKSLKEFRKCSNLIVRFGVDGAIHYSHTGNGPKAVLYYDPKVVEDGFYNLHPGEMQGLASTFVATLSAILLDQGLSGLGEGITQGILRSRIMQIIGFGKDEGNIHYPVETIFESMRKDAGDIVSIEIPGFDELFCSRKGRWSILEDIEKDKMGLDQVAFSAVYDGARANFQNVPVAEFGRLMTVDRNEIESFHTIKNLMTKFINNEGTDKPLSIAVFGQPGSGKSFGVKQLAKSIAGDKISEMEFNVSQFNAPDDLGIALNKVQNECLEGNIPLVFFDEFDSEFNEHKLGWLKYFLAPMQDGKFYHGDTMHTLGKAIFVFAGGTSHTFEKFSKPEGLSGPELSTLKVPDFLSRLRGYVNIMGPNKVGEGDNVYVIRRAILLRSILERKAEDIIDKTNNKARIDDEVILALLRVPSFTHGARSIEAIIEMSMMSRHNRFGKASLPPKEQLELHVGAEEFQEILNRHVMFDGGIDKIAKDSHEKYRKDNAKTLKPEDPARLRWDKLPLHLKEDNRRFAAGIPRKLNEMGYGCRLVIDRPVKMNKIDKKLIEEFAKREHMEWYESKKNAGWIFGPVKNAELKTHDQLKSWDNLDEGVKEKNRRMIRHIPSHLKLVKFEVYPYKETIEKLKEMEEESKNVKSEDKDALNDCFDVIYLSGPDFLAYLRAKRDPQAE